MRSEDPQTVQGRDLDELLPAAGVSHVLAVYDMCRIEIFYMLYAGKPSLDG